MLGRTLIAQTVVAVILGSWTAVSARQAPALKAVDEKVLREYTGVYRWQRDADLYLQMWDEFSGFGKPAQPVAFDESGEVRTLYPMGRDQFVAGPGAAVSTSIESQVEFHRDRTGHIALVKWRSNNGSARIGRRVDIERHEDVRFPNGDIQLTGTVIRPVTSGKHPAIVLVHASGAENREYMLPWARFLIRRGMVVLSYDKRGVGGSTGDWKTASFDDLAGDVVAAIANLSTRRDVDPARIGLLGISQAGWIMPPAGARAKILPF